VHTGVWWRDLIERSHLGYLGVERRIILKRLFKKYTGLTWLRIARGGGLL
jgi:hypothetical protein